MKSIAPGASGKADITNRVNADVTTALPIGQAISNFEPGIYAMLAKAPGDKDYWDRKATQWFIVTDLGIQSMKGADGVVTAAPGAAAGALAGRAGAETGLLDLSIRNTFAYEDSLTRAITAAFSGTDVQEALDQAAAEWDQITESVGVDDQREAYKDWASKPNAYPG